MSCDKKNRKEEDAKKLEEAKASYDAAAAALAAAEKQEADAKKKYADAEAGFPKFTPCCVHSLHCSSPLHNSLVYVCVHHPCKTH